MKNTETLKRTSKYEHVVSTECDICHRVYKGDDWEKESSYEILETEVRMKTGYSTPDGGSGEEIIIDVCPKCFNEKLIPYLKSLGCKSWWKDWDW